MVGVQALRGGVITDDYPDEEMRRLCEFLEEKKPLEVYSAFLDNIRHYEIVIKVFSDTGDRIELSGCKHQRGKR